MTILILAAALILFWLGLRIYVLKRYGKDKPYKPKIDDNGLYPRGVHCVECGGAPYGQGHAKNCSYYKKLVE